MERIHVSVRSRPLSTEDAKTSPWKISSDSIFMPNHSTLSFEFDRIFREDCKTVQVYEARTKDIVAAAVRGFNGTVFAYGQTNSGKTHTMRGSPTEPGVIPLAVHDMFETIYQDTSREFLLRMSYLEIYNEDINDLLAPEHRKLQIHENLEKGIFVAGLREEIVASPQQVLEMMEFGESHRHIGETNMNVHSSRSHTIFRMIIESRQKTQDEGVGNACDAVRVSVLNLVDLAGSERASKTGAEGVRLKEGSHINKSLMTLGTVIKKLSEGVENQGGHVPYRDSKLTRILQPALGGNANTAIICNITLAPDHADETKSSLQFASRALRVTNCAHVNEILTDAALLKRQKKEIEELRSKLKTSHSDHSDEEILNLRNTLLKSELERERIALELEEEKKAQAQREKKSSSKQNLDDLVTKATEQNICAKEKNDEIQEEIHAAREEAQIAREQLVSKESEVTHVLNENFNSLVNVTTEVEVLASEFQNFKASLETISLVMDEGLQDFASFSPLIHDFTLFMRQSFDEHASIISGYQNVQSFLKQKVLDIENEKVLLQEQCAGLQSQIEGLNQEAQKHGTSLMMLSDQNESERSDLLSHIECLEKDIASLSTSSLAKEKETLRKDFDKMKAKLKDTESKLKNVMQDKTKLEAEKASAERELKRLHSQTALLEKDISKQESFAGKRQDERNAKQSLQEEFHNLEALAFEMETTIASLEEELAAERGEKEELLCRSEGLDQEVTSLTEKLELSNTQLEQLQIDITELKARLESSSSDQQQLETKVKQLLEEKEELAMHLATSLLEMEEEKAIWSSKEKALTEAMEEKMNLYNIKIESLSKEVSEAKRELESCRLECITLADKLRCSEENAKQENESSMEKSLEIDRLGNELQSAHAVSKQSQEVLKSDIDTLKSELQRACEMSDTLQSELDYVTSERQSLLSRIEEIKKEVVSSNRLQDADADNKEKAKLKMRLMGTQARLDAKSIRHEQAVKESEVMNRKFQEASAKLKEKLASKALEVIDLKKQLSASSR
ncbi:hypothetical protein BRARA_C03246 [Brassica rapa]|uniref:Kinesin motor domain-containing protein n=1 Tax=Brassica campestris TaxID=3711 RepID=A0A398A0E9_BRACM|nr:hypothetical protein BRARA_C03246 [Brassica rapa]